MSPQPTRATRSPWHPLLWWSLWVAGLAVAVWGRPLLPIDETRYAAVAWEMWRDHHPGIPTLDGDFYAQKPPLLFWLTLLAWRLFGVVDWAPRAIVAVMGLATIGATVRLAQRLWPQRPRLASWVPLAFALCALWLLFAPAWYFDVPNALWCVLGVHGLLDVAQRRWTRGGATLLLALTAGVFTKGPLVLLTVGAVAVLAPWWGPAWAGWRAPRLWQAAMLVALAMGVAVAAYAAWLLWAGGQLGTPVWRAVLGAQATDRLSDDADHASPFWWYGPQLLWALWPAWVIVLAQRRAAVVGGTSPDAGARLVWGSGTLLLLVLSVAAGKRAHYLLGWLPLAAAWLAQWLARVDRETDPPPAWWWRLAVGLPALGVGVGLAWAIARMAQAPLYPWAGPALQVVGLVIIGWGILMAWPASTAIGWIQRVAAGTLVALFALHVWVPWAMGPSFQVQALAQRVGEAMRRGTPVAWAADGRFHGVLSFYGRLPATPEVIDPAQAPAWLAAHPGGWVLLRARPAPAGQDCTPYRSSWVCIQRGPMASP